MAQETFSNIQPIKGETFSNLTPIATQTGSTAQPGFVTRLLQSFGLPSSQAELEASAPTNVKDALIQGVKASTGLLPAIVNHAKQATRGISEGSTDIQDAGANIAEGGPVGANLGKAASGVLHATLQATPLIGAPTETAGQDVAQGNYAGAAGGLTGVTAQILAPKILEGAAKVPDTARAAVKSVKENFVEPKAPTPAPELPKPVSTPVAVDSPFDDATIRKTSGKDLSAGARETLRNAAGPVIQAGSSPELHLLKAVPEINSTIATESGKLAKILDGHGPLSSTPEAAVNSAIDSLRDSLPGGTEESFGKAIDKEVTKAKDVLGSSSPTEINDYIRTLDKSIKSYTAPEEGIDSPSNAADAARVVIRRALRDTLNSQIPATKPLNTTLSNNIEARSVLRNRLGSVADDSAAATQQYQSELAKGQAQLRRDEFNRSVNEDFDQKVKNIRRNKTILKTVGAVAGGAGLLQAGKTVAGSLIK
jgi:hypothetical protein